MRDRVIFVGQLVFTLLVASFLVVPAILSISAGVTVNYFRGIQSGVTLQWVAQVWELYAGTILLSFVVAFGRPSFYEPRVFGLLYAAVLAFNFFTDTDLGSNNAFFVIGLSLLTFALCCMICQGELARRQPEPQGLTFFYLTLAAGGAAGGGISPPRRPAAGPSPSGPAGTRWPDRIGRRSGPVPPRAAPEARSGSAGPGPRPRPAPQG